MFWFKRKPPVLTEQSSAPGKPAGEPGHQADTVEPGLESAQVSRSIMSVMNEHLIKQVNTPSKDSTAALNQQIVQAVQFTNAQTLSYAPAQIAIAPDMMIGQAAGLVAQSAAGYFDGVSKLALAAQAVMIKEMTQNIALERFDVAEKDAEGAFVTDLLVAAAAAVSAAAGAMEGAGAAAAIEMIDKSLSTYSDNVAKRSMRAASGHDAAPANPAQ